MKRYRVLLLGILLMVSFAVTSSPLPQRHKGQLVFERWCATCHSEGSRMPGTVALEAKYRGELPAVLTERTDLTAAFIQHFVRNGVSVMAPFRLTEVSDEDLDDLILYLTTTSDTVEKAP